MGTRHDARSFVREVDLAVLVLRTGLGRLRRTATGILPGLYLLLLASLELLFILGLLHRSENSI